MSHFFPSTPYAEDQRLPYAILTTHVLYRGFQTGAAVALISRSAISLVKRQPLTSSLLLRAAGTGASIGTGILSLALVGRMWGRGEIEWKDRSWALLHNQGQVAIDDWSQVGTGVGAFAGIRRAGLGLGWRGVVGGAGVGSLVGVVGCMVWGRLRGTERTE